MASPLVVYSATWRLWDSVDWNCGYSSSEDKTFAQRVAGAWTFANYTATASTLVLKARTSSPYFERLDRFACTFKTSDLPDDCVISSATLSLFWQWKSNWLWWWTTSIVATNLAASNNLVASDYSNFWTTKFGSITYANFSTNWYNNFTLNASWIANISKTWVSQFWHRYDWDIDNSFWWTWASWASDQYYYYNADYWAYWPKLTIEYTVPLSNLKTYNWIAKSNIKTINWVAIANIKSIDSIT